MKKNYVMKKLDTPKRVTLSDGRTFVARFRRAKRSELPNNISMKRTYRNNFAKDARKGRTSERRKRKRQSKKGIFFSILKKPTNIPILEILQEL